MVIQWLSIASSAVYVTDWYSLALVALIGTDGHTLIINYVILILWHYWLYNAYQLHQQCMTVIGTDACIVFIN